MAVHQSKHQSDLEKRLKILRQQFYGKNDLKISTNPSTALGTGYPLPASRGEPTTNRLTDVTYLRADLTKISILAGGALTLQIILYFLIRNNVLNINLF